MSAVAESFWSTLPLGRGVTLLTHDANGLAAFDKPAGVLSHPNAGGDEPRSLLTVRYHLDGEYYEWTPAPGAAPQRLWLLNRLDSATSGVILVAAEAELAQTVRAHFKRANASKGGVVDLLLLQAEGRAVAEVTDEHRLATAPAAQDAD